MNRDEFAEALDSAYSKLKTFMKESTADLDAEINVCDVLLLLYSPELNLAS